MTYIGHLIFDLEIDHEKVLILKSIHYKGVELRQHHVLFISIDHLCGTSEALENDKIDHADLKSAIDWRSTRDATTRHLQQRNRLRVMIDLNPKACVRFFFLHATVQSVAAQRAKI